MGRKSLRLPTAFPSHHPPLGKNLNQSDAQILLPGTSLLSHEIHPEGRRRTEGQPLPRLTLGQACAYNTLIHHFSHGVSPAPWMRDPRLGGSQAASVPASVPSWLLAAFLTCCGSSWQLGWHRPVRCSKIKKEKGILRSIWLFREKAYRKC